MLAGLAGLTQVADARREAGIGVWPVGVVGAVHQVLRHARLHPSGGTMWLAAGACRALARGVVVCTGT